MAEDDIYGNKKAYERYKESLPQLIKPPSQRTKTTTAKYYCKNPANLEYFKRLFTHFEALDLSYIRRNRVLNSMRFLCHATTKDLACLDRNDVDEIMATMHETYASPKTKETFIHDFKCVYRVLFPEKDEYGRPDETLTPYAVRHLSARMDKSKIRLRGDRLELEEFERLVDYFASDPRMQAYLTLALESLRRPQEILCVRMSNVELHDNYAKIYAHHGKEGPGLVQCLDSYPYVLKWLNAHPLKNDPNAWLFINTGNTNRCCQLKPANINKMIRKACKDLNIQKRVTCYSLKRNGVTQRRLRGETDLEIQHAAGWTSTKQLKAYDLTSQEDAFKKKLQDRGLLPGKEPPKTKTCHFCQQTAGYTETICQNCKRPLDRENLAKEQKEKDETIHQLKEEIRTLKEQFQDMHRHVAANLMADILETMPRDYFRRKKSRKRVCFLTGNR